MKISNELKQFINDNKELIDNNKFQTLYRKLNNNIQLYSHKDVGMFTTILYNVGINPLRNMEYIPSYFLSFTDIKDFKIPKNIVFTYPSAFYHSNLEYIDLSIIDKLGRDAFEGCGKLKEVTIPKSIYYIGEGCFSFCTSLEKIIFNTELDFIPPSCFVNCTKLTHIDLPREVTSIGQEAFLGSGLKSINIKENLQTISPYALPKSCTDIYYNGTKKQWGKINIDSKIYPRVVHCIDGELEIDA